MSIYTVSSDLLENIEDDERFYFRDVLFVFSIKSPSIKIAKDKNGEILEIYRNITKNADIIKTWLEVMSYKPARFEKVDVDLKEISCIETKFLELCSSTKDNKQLIMYSKENFKTFICSQGKIDYKGIIINVLDRDEANNTLNCINSTNITYNNSQVAMNGSQITKSNNKIV